MFAPKVQNRPRFLTRLLYAAALAAVIALPGAASAQYAGAEAVPDNLKKGFDDITPAECKPWDTFLSTKCDGRGSGQPGFQKAADYMAGQFKKYGLKPMGDNGTYFQQVPFVRSKVDDSSTVAVASADSRWLLKQGHDVNVRATKDAEANGKIVFVKAKGANAALPTDADFTGKVVVLVVDKAVPGPFRFSVMRKSPAGVLFASDNIGTSTWSVSGANRPARGGGFLTGQITFDAAKHIAQLAKVDPSAADAASGEDGVKTFDSDGTISFQIKVQTENITVPNVVGELEGSDPVLKDETIGIGAHLDHLGKQGKVVYPGADDDGSGTTALIAVMKAMAANPEKPKRSILFMNFCGEELGLIGSKYLSEHPMVPLDKMICELQMDMVGRNSETATDRPQDNVDTIRLVGSKRISTELDDLVQSENKLVNFRFKYDEEAVYGRSDHYNFAAKGVPIAFLFDGFHPDYHQPTDTVDKINFDKIANTAKLFYLVGEEAADRPSAFKHDVQQAKGG